MNLPKEIFDLIDNEFEEEKGFYKVFKNSCVHDKNSPRTLLGFLILLLIILMLAYIVASSNKSKDAFSSLLDCGLTFSVGILGFLIAGFSIYSTMIDKELTYLLLIFKEDNKKISKFHHNYLIFFKPFAFFLALLLFTIGFKFLLSVWVCINVTSILILLNIDVVYYNVFVCLIIGFYTFLMLICVYSLKTFIYNIYQSAKAIGRLELYRRNCNLDEYIKSIYSKYSK